SGQPVDPAETETGQPGTGPGNQPTGCRAGSRPSADSRFALTSINNLSTEPIPMRSFPFKKSLMATFLATGAMMLAVPADEAVAAGANPQVLMKTSLGEIVIELYPEKAPKTVENFLKYVD